MKKLVNFVKDNVNPKYAAIGAGGLALFGVGAFVIAKRRRANR